MELDVDRALGRKLARNWRLQREARTFMAKHGRRIIDDLLTTLGIPPVGSSADQMRANWGIDTPRPGVADEVIHRHTGPVGSRMSDGRAGSVVSGEADG